MNKLIKTIKFGWKILLLIFITFEIALLLNNHFLKIVPQIVIFIGIIVTIFVLYVTHSKINEENN